MAVNEIPWGEEEIKTIVDNTDVPVVVLAEKHFGGKRSTSSIYAKRAQLIESGVIDKKKVKTLRNRRWTDEEKDYIRKTMDIPAHVVAAALGRSVQSVQQVRVRVNTEDGRVLVGNQLSKEEQAFIRDNRDFPVSLLSAKLNRSRTTIYRHLRKIDND